MFSGGVLLIYAASDSEGVADYNIYQPNGTLINSQGERAAEMWLDKLKDYDNIKSIGKTTQSGNIADISQYVEIK